MALYATADVGSGVVEFKGCRVHAVHLVWVGSRYYSLRIAHDGLKSTEDIQNIPRTQILNRDARIHRLLTPHGLDSVACLCGIEMWEYIADVLAASASVESVSHVHVSSFPKQGRVTSRTLVRI